ncbi:MAG: hypothetical protein HY334_01005 [Armatimonadetes bacterium]|nr:hypothetical protein [Armatimonadota bacterium]
MHAAGPDGPRGSGATIGQPEPPLRSSELRLIARIRNDWAVQFGSREVRLIIEYQDGVPVLIRVIENAVKEEKLK